MDFGGIMKLTGKITSVSCLSLANSLSTVIPTGEIPRLL